jgi:uncharacterized YigZ family protein
MSVDNAAAGETMCTISAARSAEIKEKGSRFIARALPVGAVHEAEVHIARIRRSEHAATHHCYAYRIGPGGEESRTADDGEPSGTAGQPIMRQIDGKRLTNIVVVVTRYFGGVKLGTGGLARAYGDAAAAVLSTCRFLEVVPKVRISIRFRYEDTAPVMRIVSRLDAEVIGSRYSDDALLELQIPASHTEAFESAFVEALGGRGEVISVVD